MSEENILKEGQRLSFVITNKVTLPGTDEVNLILLGPDHKKYLLAEQYYGPYNLSVGQTINCSVDKINCSGKIFLEPDHPYYKVGERYNFRVLRITSQENFLGEPLLSAWVKDLHGLEWPCPIDNSVEVTAGSGYLSCRVDRIRKGILKLSLPEVTNRFTSLISGRNYMFKLNGIKSFQDEEFYIFEDPEGHLHRLPVANYLHYGLIPGQTVEATVVKYKSNGECLIEPVHPYYKIGETYSFKYKELQKSADLFGRVEAVITVIDALGQEIKVKPLTWQIEHDDYRPESITCLVQRFKKGRPVLINLES